MKSYKYMGYYQGARRRASQDFFVKTQTASTTGWVGMIN